MRFIIVGMVLCWMLLMPASAKAEEMEFKLDMFSEELKVTLANNKDWERCGNYFAAGESTEGKIIHFRFPITSRGERGQAFVFTNLHRVTVSISEAMSSPLLIVYGRGQDALFTIELNDAEYQSGLPCLDKGPGP